MRLSNTLRIFAALHLLCSLSGCASIVSKSEYPVAIDSTPSGVDFYITDSTGTRVHENTTPSTLTLKTKRGYFKPHTYTIHLQPQGLPAQQHVIRNSMDGWYFGNLLLGGLLGMLIVDPLTGAMFKYPAEVNVQIGEPSASAGEQTLKIASIDILDAEQRSRLVPLNR